PDFGRACGGPAATKVVESGPAGARDSSAHCGGSARLRSDESKGQRASNNLCVACSPTERQLFVTAGSRSFTGRSAAGVQRAGIGSKDRLVGTFVRNRQGGAIGGNGECSRTVLVPGWPLHRILRGWQAEED